MAKLSNVDGAAPKLRNYDLFERKRIDQQAVLMILVELMMILGKVINPVILALVMVDHHYGDECYSGDDHRSYDDDH